MVFDKTNFFFIAVNQMSQLWIVNDLWYTIPGKTFSYATGVSVKKSALIVEHLKEHVLDFSVFCKPPEMVQELVAVHE